MKFTIALAVLLLAACNPQPPDETVFDDQLETLDRAREVEETLNDRAAKIGERLEEGNEDPPQ